MMRRPPGRTRARRSRTKAAGSGTCSITSIASTASSLRLWRELLRRRCSIIDGKSLRLGMSPRNVDIARRGIDARHVRPMRASGSHKMPPPQPISRMRAPSNALCLPTQSGYKKHAADWSHAARAWDRNNTTTPRRAPRNARPLPRRRAAAKLWCDCYPRAGIAFLKAGRETMSRQISRRADIASKIRASAGEIGDKDPDIEIGGGKALANEVARFFQRLIQNRDRLLQCFSAFPAMVCIALFRRQKHRMHEIVEARPASIR